MTIQNFYPVFENGQVLTSASLNEIIDYLEPQDRLTRSRLIGIGVVCGLKPVWDGTVLTISKGVAITSAGFLIAEPEAVLDRARPYTVPQPQNPDATDAEKAEARYPFLFNGAVQKTAFELLPTAFQPAAGEAAPTPLTPQFMTGKTVLAFLERSRASLKNCDINDCADRGSEMSVTLRWLLVSRADADAILQQERAIAGHPVDLAHHPRWDLAPVHMEKVNPAGVGALTYPALIQRYFDCAQRLIDRAMFMGDRAFRAYLPMLEPLWPPQTFPDGPLPPHHVLPLFGHFAWMPALAQCLYDAGQAQALALNEFLAAAAVYGVECAPDEARFPRHVLLGDPLAPVVAYANAPQSLQDLANFDTSTITGGPALAAPPLARRHNFVPSPLIGEGHASELRALFQRFVLLAQSFDLRQLIKGPIRITPSRDGAAALGDRAIPAWAAFATDGDLYANWSWPRSRAGLRGSVAAYALTPDDMKYQPLLLRDDAVDFLRIEGLVGRALGSAIDLIAKQRQALGLTFSMVPVLISIDKDPDARVAADALAAMKPMLACQMRDLDAVFLTLMRELFSFTVWLVRTLGPIPADQLLRRDAMAPAKAMPAKDQGLLATAAVLQPVFINLNPLQEKFFGQARDSALSDLRSSATIRPDLVRQLALLDAGVEVPPLAVAEIYTQTRDRLAGGELIDRVAIAVRAVDATVDAGAVYPAIALMARAEEMMAATSATSFAEFDEVKFSTALRGLGDAYESYAARAETDPAKVGAAVAAANAAILQNRAAMAAAASLLSDKTLTTELQNRLSELFQQRLFDTFATQHPGIEHKGGVPVGGTLVLLYAHRDEMPNLVVNAMAAVEPALKKAFSQYLPKETPTLDAKAVIDTLFQNMGGGQFDLDNFVILGDMCLPTMCCDAECAAPQPGKTLPFPFPEPDLHLGTIEGTVMLQDAGKEFPTKGAVVTATGSNGSTTTQKLADEKFAFDLPAGSYLVRAELGAHREEQKTDLKAGLRNVLFFSLK